MTKTFANPEELMIALLQDEKWKLDYFDSIFLYDKNFPVSPFRVMISNGNSSPIDNLYDYCDGKTLWAKIGEKTELDLMKEKYASEDYIAVYFDRVPHINRWVIKGEHGYLGRCKLIHKKHKDILDAYLADNSVEIEMQIEFPDMSYFGRELVEYFIDSYGEDNQYQLKPIENTISLAILL